MITSIDPYQFYDLVKIAEDFKRPVGFEALAGSLDSSFDSLEEDLEFLSEAYNAMLAEARRSTRRPSSFRDDPNEMKFEHVSGANFVALVLQYVRTFHSATREIREIVRELQPATFLFLGDRKFPTSAAQMQEFSTIINLNSSKVSSFTNMVSQAYALPKTVVELARSLVRVQEAYYQVLSKRHSVDGIKIQIDPVRTDLALCLYENIDGHGEVAGGKKVDEISAYSMRKATLLADTLTDDFFQTYLKNPGEIVNYLKNQLVALWDISTQMSAATKEPAEKVRRFLHRGLPPRIPSYQDFKDTLLTLEDLDPRNIEESDKVGMLSPEEKLDMDFRNETLLTLSTMLGRSTSQELVAYVLARKEKWYIEQRDVNSFYVCRIGSGNPFGGEAPGMLEVVPGVKPKVNLDEIVGQGFDEVRAMIDHAKNSSKWTDLFMATSPSKKVDKMNVLLVGPMGCGKTEALRALGSDEKSVGIFAQASDFLTCWKGEAEKNPKRLFEAGLRLQKESERQVFFLIDEIDTILNGDRGQAAFGGTNLATEFQILMDGITTYPNLAVWGATNHPERIPMPIIRRFAKVIVVGELTMKDRINLLRRFTSYLPLAKDFDDEAWTDVAKMLDGAVGDTVRKVTDHVWREKMFGFVSKKPNEAEEIIKYLQEGGMRFDHSKATTEWRAKFHEKLRPYVQVRPGDLLQAAQTYLDNPAIKQEIKTAVETYKVAKEHLVGMVAPRI
jgi:hypothetical protein